MGNAKRKKIASLESLVFTGVEVVVVVVVIVVVVVVVVQ